MSLTFRSRPTVLTAEILDELPPDHPDAIASRRDLRFFNVGLGNAPWIVKTLKRHARAGERVLEIGAGTGDLALALHREGIACDALDRAPQPATWPSAFTWHQVDVFDFDGWDYDIIVANLFLHHFNAEQLAILGQRMARHARLLVVGEVRRGSLQALVFRIYAVLIGANHVSRHDGIVSIRAGFHGDELPRSLGLRDADWRHRVDPAQLCAYRWIGERR